MIDMKRWFWHISMVALMAVMVVLSSCSGSDYLNAIPARSTALISIDMQKMAEDNKLADKAGLLKSVLQVDDVSDCGIDVASKVYLFETADGNLGLCAHVADAGDLEQWLDKLSSQHTCTKVTERKGFHFSVLKDSWLVGFSDNALLVMGPVVADAQADLQRKMARYLAADEEAGIKSSPMFDRLDTIPSAMAMVAQAQALPEKFVAPFTLGAPKGADASQIVIAAEMNIHNGILLISGETFSFNKGIDEELKKATANYRPIKGKYVKSMPADALVGIFMNVDGNQFLPMMKSSQGIQQLLMGINTVIDMDNIIRSVNGDMAIVLPTLSDDGMKMMMSAQLANTKWLADVDYWKKSCPQGTSIADWGKNSFCYSDGKTSFCFGVSDDMQFFSGSDELTAEYSIKTSNHPVSQDVQKAIVGQKMAMVINLSGVDNEAMSVMTGLLSPLFGDLNSIVYTLKK